MALRKSQRKSWAQTSRTPASCSPRCLSRALGFPKRLRPALPFCFCLFLSLALPSSDIPLSEEAADSGSEASPPALLSPSTLRIPGFTRQWSSGEKETHELGLQTSHHWSPGKEKGPECLEIVSYSERLDPSTRVPP